MEILLLASKGELNNVNNFELDQGTTVCVVLASPGYPEKPITGSEIIIKNNLNVLHAGTEQKNDRLYSKGGRVLNIIGKGANLTIARNEAYKSIKDIQWKDMSYRSDIGLIENE